VEGIHSRTDFDLSKHEEFSGKKLRYFDPETNESYIPYVVETSIGLDRMFLLTLCAAYQEEAVEGGEVRTVLKLHPALAPVKTAILPLVKKDGLPEMAEKIYNDLRFDFKLYIEDKDSIGKRYRRMDAIGTPFCITVDHESLTNEDVTIRHRDTMEQRRVKVAELRDILNAETSLSALLKKLA